MAVNAAHWAAIVDKDESAANDFVYCVKSTKIYCRPTCKARLPRRTNVTTFGSPSEALEAGYRPCKRCRPELASYTPQDDKIQRACDIICQYSLGPDNPRLDMLAQETGLTKYHFHRLFKRKTGLTPRQFAQALRSSDQVLNSDALFTTDQSQSPSSDGFSSTDGDNALSSYSFSVDAAYDSTAQATLLPPLDEPAAHPLFFGIS